MKMMSWNANRMIVQKWSKLLVHCRKTPELKCKQNKLSKKVDVKVVPQKNYDTEKHEEDELECKQNDSSKMVKIMGSPQKNNNTGVHELKHKQNKLSKKINMKVVPQKKSSMKKTEEGIELLSTLDVQHENHDNFYWIDCNQCKNPVGEYAYGVFTIE